MKLKIPFDEISTGFSNSTETLHFYIDTVENTVNVTDDIDHQEEYERLTEDDRYLFFPSQNSHENFKIMESFAYSLPEKEFELSEKLLDALQGRKPFRNFKDALLSRPKQREQWFKYQDEAIKNQAIDWLCENDVELEGQKLIDVKIAELDSGSTSQLPKDLTTFLPRACLKCQNKQGLVPRWFKLNGPIANALAEREAKRIMSEQFNVTHYGFCSHPQGEFLTASKCPKCGSESNFWDYSEGSRKANARKRRTEEGQQKL